MTGTIDYDRWYREVPLVMDTRAEFADCRAPVWRESDSGVSRAAGSRRAEACRTQRGAPGTPVPLVPGHVAAAALWPRSREGEMA